MMVKCEVCGSGTFGAKVCGVCKNERKGRERYAQQLRTGGVIPGPGSDDGALDMSELERYLVAQRNEDGTWWATFDDLAGAEQYAADELLEGWVTEAIVDLDEQRIYGLEITSTGRATGGRELPLNPAADANPDIDAALGAAVRRMYASWEDEGYGSSADQCDDLYAVLNAHGLVVR